MIVRGCNKAQSIIKDDMSSLIWTIEKLGKSTILSARCRSKIALFDQTGPAAFGSEAERCVIITH